MRSAIEFEKELRDFNNQGRSLSKVEYEAMLDVVRKRQLASIEGTLLPGVSALGAPVFDHRGVLAAALMVVGHRGLMNTKPDGPVATALTKSARALSQRLGFQAVVTDAGKSD